MLPSNPGKNLFRNLFGCWPKDPEQKVAQTPSRCGCIEKTTIFKVALVVGVPIAALGALSLVCVLISSGMSTPFLTATKDFVMNLAATLGTDALTLGIFVTSSGALLALGGGIGWAVEARKASGDVKES